MNDEEKKTIEKLKEGKKIGIYEVIRTFKREGIENFVITREKYIDTVLNLIEKQDKIINEMADEMANIDYDYMCGNWCGNETGCDGEERAACIKKIFYRESR